MKLLRASKVAEKLGVSVPSVWRLAKTTQFPKGFKISEGITVWDEQELDGYISSLKQEYRNETVRNEGLSAC
jgi:predicted DNA-binding transcriptional regulator AlpA